MPAAEARHLAGTGPGWPATAEARVLTGVREWLAGVSRRRTAFIPVRKVVTDLTLILDAAPLPRRPVRGPFGPGRAGPPLPGQADYLGGGIVRLDDAAITALASLPPGEDFRVIHTGAGPVLAVGTDSYPAREEEPDPKPGQADSPPGP
jgi:hypothetical protein